MSKLKTVMLVLMAVLAVSAVAASSASAQHVWLSEGKEVLKETKGLWDGLLLLHHKFPAIVGGGEMTIHCTLQWHLIFDPLGLAKILLLLGLKGEETKVDCEVSSSTNAICKAGELVLVNALHLPWHLLLELPSGMLRWVLLKESGKIPGVEAECKSIKISCEGEERAKFVENTSSGSIFEFIGELSSTCSDGGTATLLGKGEVLGFQAS
jgi:hypothetical protein